MLRVAQFDEFTKQTDVSFRRVVDLRAHDGVREPQAEFRQRPLGLGVDHNSRRLRIVSLKHLADVLLCQLARSVHHGIFVFKVWELQKLTEFVDLDDVRIQQFLELR